jgi:hypothetical protein
VPKMHVQNDAYADHARIKGLGHSLFRMSKVHVYPRYHRRHRSDEIGIRGLAKCRLERTEVRPVQLAKIDRGLSGENIGIRNTHLARSSFLHLPSVGTQKFFAQV